MAAIGQQPQHIRVLVISQADGATGGGGVLVLQLGLRVEELGVAQEGGLVEAGFYIHDWWMPVQPGELARMVRCVSCMGASAIVRGEGDGGDE